MIKRALLALLIALPAAAQLSVSDFTGGLNSRVTSILLPENQATDASNVIVDESAAVTRRSGYSKLNGAAIGDGDDDVNATYQFRQSDGDSFCLSFSSTTGYVSTDSCGTFSAFVSTLTRNNDVNCDFYNDNAFCVNDQYNFLFDGSDEREFISTPSDLDFIRVFRNRCFASGEDANPSRLYWSNLGDCTTWDTATDFVDVDAEDGDVINGIGESFLNFLPICKEYSTHLLQFSNANPSERKLIKISDSIGCRDHRAVAIFKDQLFMASLGPDGGQPGIYATDGVKFAEISGAVRAEFEALDSVASFAGRKTIDTLADWEAGTFQSDELSATRSPGFMRSSFTQHTDSLSPEFAEGIQVNVTTRGVAGEILIYQGATATFVNAGADGSNNDNWEGATLEYEQNGFGCFPTAGVGASWVNENNQSTDPCNFDMTFEILDVDDNVLKTEQFTVTDESPCNYETISLLDLGVNRVKLKVSEPIRGDVAISSPFIIGDAISIAYGDADETGGGSCRAAFDIDESGSLSSSGTFTSRSLDSYIASPLYGVFGGEVSSNTGSGLSFNVQSSVDDSTWESLASQTFNGQYAGVARRYSRYQALFFVGAGTDTPAAIQSTTLSAAATGHWRSPEQELSEAMTTWGVFNTVEETDGSTADIDYCMRTSTFTGGAASNGAGCVSVTPGSLITASTGAYVIVESTYTTFRPTDTAKTDTIIIGWNEGEGAASISMKPFAGRLHTAVQSSGGSVNDTVFVLDSKGAWTRFDDVYARHLNVVDKNFVVSGSTKVSGGFLYKFYDTDADAGNAISAYWESKDHPLTKIQNLKSVDRIFIVHSNDATTLTVTLKRDGGAEAFSTDVNLSTGAPFGVAQIVVEPPLEGHTFRLRFGNDAASAPWEVYGYGLYYRETGLMQP